MSEHSFEQDLYDCIWSRKAKNEPSGKQPLRVKAAADLATGGEKLLDIGCGDGLLAGLVNKKYSQIYGVEFSEAARRLAEAKGVITENININSQSLPFDDNTFDAVAGLDIVEHVFEPDKFLEEVFRVLKPEGFFILSTPNVRYLRQITSLIFKGRSPRTSSDKEGYDGGHVHYFTYKDIELLLEKNGFAQIERFGLYRWEHFTVSSKIKDTIKNILGKRLKEEFFSSAVIIRARKV